MIFQFRVRSVFSGALKSWEFPRLQRAALQSLSSLLSEFEAAALTEGNRANEIEDSLQRGSFPTIGTSAQPLAFHDGREIADIARGYVVVKDEPVTDSTDVELIVLDNIGTISSEIRNKEIDIHNLSVKNQLRIKVSSGISETERVALQGLALTILGQLTRQGLVNPIAISEILFTLLFHPKENLRDRALDVLKVKLILFFCCDD